MTKYQTPKGLKNQNESTLKWLNHRKGSFLTSWNHWKIKKYLDCPKESKFQKDNIKSHMGLLQLDLIWLKLIHRENLLTPMHTIIPTSLKI